MSTYLSYPRDPGTLYLESSSWKIHQLKAECEVRGLVQYRGKIQELVPEYFDSVYKNGFLDLGKSGRVIGKTLFDGTEGRWSFSHVERSTSFRLITDVNGFLPPLPDRPEINHFLLAALKDEFALLVMADWLEENDWAESANEIRNIAARRK